MSENDKIMLLHPISSKTIPVSQSSSVMQNWLQENCPGLLKLSGSESTGLSHLDCHVWSAILEKYDKLQPKPKATDELKVAAHHLRSATTGTH